DDTPERHLAREALLARLNALNPAAPILDAAAGEATPARLLDCGLYDPEQKIPDVKRWLAEEAYATAALHHDEEAYATTALHHDHAHHHDANRHDERIRAFTLTAETPIPTAAFEMFIDLVRSLHGAKLLRLKGIVKIAEEPERPLVIHGVQHVMHPPVRLERWPDADERTRIVVITRDLAPEAVTRVFDAFLERPAAPPPARHSSTTPWCRLAVSIVDAALVPRISSSYVGDPRKALGLALATRGWLHDAAVAVSRVQRADGRRHEIHRAALG